MFIFHYFQIELCSTGTKRFDSEKAGDREVQRTMLELLNQMDGFQPNAQIKVRFVYLCLRVDRCLNISKHYNLRGCSTWHCLCYYSDMFRVFWYTLEEKSFDKKIINLLKMDFFFVLKGDSSHQQSGHSGSCSPEVREVRQKDRIPPPQWRGQGQNSTDSLP